MGRSCGLADSSFRWLVWESLPSLPACGAACGLLSGYQDPGDITQYYAALKRRNEYEESEIDKVFIMRQEKERAVAELEAQCRAIQVR